MKIFISAALFILTFGFCAFGQAKKPPAKEYIKIETTDDGATSELLPIVVNTSPILPDTKIGIKYFGTAADSDISFLILLKTTKPRYATGESFGVRMLIDDVPISSNKLRAIPKVDKTDGGEIIHFYITTEDLAWLATGQTIKLVLFQTEKNQKLDTIIFTAANVIELKRFAKSVYLIRSKG